MYIYVDLRHLTLLKFIQMYHTIIQKYNSEKSCRFATFVHIQYVRDIDAQNMFVRNVVFVTEEATLHLSRARNE